MYKISDSYVHTELNQAACIHTWAVWLVHLCVVPVVPAASTPLQLVSNHSTQPSISTLYISVSGHCRLVTDPSKIWQLGTQCNLLGVSLTRPWLCCVFTRAWLISRGLESESETSRVRILAQSWRLSFEGDSDSTPYLSHLDFCDILLLFIWLLCNLFLN